MDFFEALTHVIPLLSFLSTLYPLISHPPSTTGLFQEIVTAVLLTVSISGFDGGPGGPDKNNIIHVIFQAIMKMKETYSI